MADTPDLGRALAEFAAACSVMAEPSASAPPPQPRVEDAVPAFLGRAAAAEAARQAPSARAQVQSPPQTPAAPPAASMSQQPPVLRSDLPAAPQGSAEGELPEGRPAPVGVRSEETVREMERRLGLRQPEL
jgi:hypothetical protein